MNVAELMEKIAVRQGELSNERYAHYLNISGVTLFRWKAGERQPDLASIRSMADYYKKIGDTEMLNALSSYALFGGNSLS